MIFRKLFRGRVTFDRMLSLVVCLPRVVSVRVHLCFSLVLGALPISLVRAEPRSPNFNEEMQFVYFQPCIGTASFCAASILAVGQITTETAASLRKLAPTRGTNLYLHSPGGDLFGGLELGRAIRELELNTITGGSVEHEESSSDFKVLIERSICASAAAFAFLGGIRREILSPESFLLHQFYSRLGYSPESSTQRTVLILNQYLDEMGVDRRLLDQMLTTTPERLASLSVKELWKLGVYNSAYTAGWPEEIEGEIARHNSQWKVEFASNSIPQLLVRRETPFKNGRSFCAISHGNIGIEIRIGVDWDNSQKGETLSTVFTSLAGSGEPYGDQSGQSAVGKAQQRIASFIKAYWEGHFTEVCFTSSEGQSEGACDLRKKVLSPAWKRKTNFNWELVFYLTNEELRQLKIERPINMKLFCRVPNVFIKFDFCEDFVLAEEFWKQLELLK